LNAQSVFILIILRAQKNALDQELASGI